MKSQPFIDLDQLESREIIPGFSGRFVHSQNMTMVFWEIKAGTILPEHAHHHEQISQVTEGQFELSIEGKNRLMTVGSMAVIPSHARHSGKAITDCKIVDIFCPIREDYL